MLHGSRLQPCYSAGSGVTPPAAEPGRQTCHCARDPGGAGAGVVPVGPAPGTSSSPAYMRSRSQSAISLDDASGACQGALCPQSSATCSSTSGDSPTNACHAFSLMARPSAG